LARLERIGLAGIYIRQRSAVDDPLGLGSIQQTLQRAGSQKIGLNRGEGAGAQRVAVDLPDYVMFFGSLQSRVQTEQSAGSGDQDTATPHGLPPQLGKDQP